MPFPRDPSETAEIAAALNGDRAAFGRLFQLYAPMVHGLLLARVPPPVADDLVQDVFLVALQKLGTLADHGAFGGWLATIARNRVIDHYRGQKKERVEVEDAPAAGIARDGSEIAEARQILGIIQALPEAYRETLVLRLVEGMSGPEIAAQVGLTPESVRVNLHRGMKLLKEKLEQKP